MSVHQRVRSKTGDDFLLDPCSPGSDFFFARSGSQLSKGSKAGWLVGRLVGRSVGWLVGWSVGWLVGRKPAKIQITQPLQQQ